MVVRLLGCGAVGAVVAEKLYSVSDFALGVDEERRRRYSSGLYINGRKYLFPMEGRFDAKKADLLIVAVKNFDLHSVLVYNQTSLYSVFNGRLLQFAR